LPGSSKSDTGVPAPGHENDWYPPTAFEIACGWLHGTDAAAIVTAEAHGHPRDLLRDVLREEVVGGSCVIPFSGGRDSSLVLAVACDVAREAGAQLPTALTYRYPGLASADESEWQHLAIDHLAQRGLRPTWVRRDIDDEFDVVGPLVTPYLAARRHVLWPPSIAPSIGAAREGLGTTVLTGEYGDEVFGVHRATLLAGTIRRRARGLTRVDARAIASAATPGLLRAGAARLGGRAPEWLNAAGQRRWRRAASRDQLESPLRWDRAVRHVVAARSATVGGRALRALAAEHGMRDVAPLADPRFIASFASFGGAYGVESRSAAVRLLAGELLPPALIARRSKAYFDGSVYNRHTSALLRGWRSVGQAAEWVDVARLRELWRAGRPTPGTGSLVQAAWLEHHGLSS
jgi:asparagine synthetase B (glutamine-hydrolysing)